MYKRWSLQSPHHIRPYQWLEPVWSPFEHHNGFSVYNRPLPPSVGLLRVCAERGVLWTCVLACLDNTKALIQCKNFILAFHGHAGQKKNLRLMGEIFNASIEIMRPVIIKQIWQQCSISTVLLANNQQISNIFSFTQHSQALPLRAHVNSSCCWDRSLCPACETLRRGEQQREHFISTVLQNIVVISLKTSEYSMKNEKAVKREAKCHLFQMQTSTLKTLSRIKWHYVETRGVIHLSVTNTVTCFNLKTSETIFETSQTISPRWHVCFLLFCGRQNQIELNFY